MIISIHYELKCQKTIESFKKNNTICSVYRIQVGFSLLILIIITARTRRGREDRGSVKPVTGFSTTKLAPNLDVSFTPKKKISNK